MSPPSIAEIRSVGQPEAILRRPSAEHWSAQLYMRRLSPYATRAFLGARLSADTVTALMIPVGIAAGAVLGIAGVAAAIGAALLVQFQVLLDCSDGEVARWRRTSSARGTYLDQIAHYSTEAALAAGLGVRAAGGWDNAAGGWTSLGLLLALLIVLLKAETHLVRVALVAAGRDDRSLGDGPAPGGTPRSRLRLRDGVRILPGLRPFQAVEASLLALAAAIVDTATGTLDGSRALLSVLSAAALVAVVGHFVAIVRSDRLG